MFHHLKNKKKIIPVAVQWHQDFVDSEKMFIVNKINLFVLVLSFKTENPSPIFHLLQLPLRNLHVNNV